MKTVTREDLAQAVYKAMPPGTSMADAKGYVEDAIGAIAVVLAAGETVKIINFGTFTVRSKRARMGRNPKRPEEQHEISARRSLRFTAARELKDRVARRAP